MAKVVFPNRIDGKICLCPFMGYKIESIDDFKDVIKQYYDQEKGYPGLYFKLNDRRHTLIFAGHQYEHSADGKWCLFDTLNDKYPQNWFKLNDRWSEVFSLFEDAEELQRKADRIGEIIKANNGIWVNV